jgi:hypothetical protein
MSHHVPYRAGTAGIYNNYPEQYIHSIMLYLNIPLQLVLEFIFSFVYRPPRLGLGLNT